ncbi:MAG: DUF2799 domain-containing protein [Gammaproteobacteria bacterium]|nr:DUF2799 domain-containing protein [Gammaproteobacteria bacterium]
MDAPRESVRPAARLGFGLSGLVIVAMVVVFALQSCATLSEEDCLTVDWGVLGETDGQLGRPLSELNRYRRDCAEYDVVPDSRAYTEGRERGLAVYCTESNGYREGRNGAADRLVCPAALEPGFRRGYDLGRAVHVSLSELRASNDAIGSARAEIDQLESDIADHRESIRSDDLDDEERKGLDDEVDSMERRIKELKRNIGIQTAGLAISIAQYQAAVGAARRDGYDEPMEIELLQALRRLVE